VRDHYWKTLTKHRAIRRWRKHWHEGEIGMVVLWLMQADLRQQDQSLEAIRALLAMEGIEMTECRLLSHLIWSFYKEKYG
jgi:hypothetical protein